MKHLGTKRIETDRLILRKFTAEDCLPMYSNWASDAEVTKYLTWPPHTSTVVTGIILQQWVDCYARDDFYQWAIELKSIGEPIGSISVVSQDDRIRKAEIGYCLGRPWWRQGIMSEALRAVIDFMIDEVGMNRVEAKHDRNNPNSGAVMRKCGMCPEGTHRQADWNNQGVCDVSTYAVLAAERCVQ